MPEALGFVYQDQEGIWQFIGATAVSQTSHTVSMATNHFSDWALLSWMTLFPIADQLHEKQQITLEALHYIALPDKDAPMIVPMVADYQNGYPVGEPQALPDTSIEAKEARWKRHQTRQPDVGSDPNALRI